jgi:hypothetical protein
MAFFGVATWPFRTHIGIPPAGQVPDVNHVDIKDEFRCYFGLKMSRHKLAARGVKITYVKDLHSARNRTVCTISIKQLVGNGESMREFIGTLGDVSHMSDVIFGMDRWQRDRVEPLGFVFLRPIITSCGKVDFSQGTLIDAYGYNGGKDIIVPEIQRTAMGGHIEMLSCSAPVPTKIKMYEWYERRQSQPGFSYEKLRDEYNLRRSQQTPEQRAAEDKAVQDYANGNREPGNIYEGAMPKDFDPQAFSRKRTLGVHPHAGEKDEWET